MSLHDDVSVWETLRSVEQQWLREAFALWERIQGKEQTLDTALRRPKDRETALHLLLLLGDQAVLQRLFSVLIDLVSVGHSDIALCRTVIKSMNRRWVLGRIEQEVTPLLQRGGEEEYRRIAELYAELDNSLLMAHVKRAVLHSNPEIQEVGQDFRSLVVEKS